MSGLLDPGHLIDTSGLAGNMTVLFAECGLLVGFSRPDSRLFRAEHVERSRAFFQRNGARTVVLARFVPIVRTFAGTPRYRTRGAAALLRVLARWSCSRCWRC